MDWMDSMDIDAQAWDFHDIDSIATPLYEAASQKLEELERKFDHEARARRAGARTEDEHELARQEEEWEAALHSQRRQALGALALHLLQLSLKERLVRAKKYFDVSHPPRPPYPSNKGWPHCLKAEYIDRFSINFDHSPVPFSRIEELVLARNAGIHADSCNLEYLEGKIKNPRFVNEDHAFSVDPSSYRSAVQDAKDFMRWIVSELKHLQA